MRVSKDARVIALMLEALRMEIRALTTLISQEHGVSPVTAAWRKNADKVSERAHSTDE